MLLSDCKKTFLGKCLGVGLAERYPGDPHIVVYIFFHDDGEWVERDMRFSSHWLPDLAEQIKLATKWMKKNAEKEEFGYIFKNE